MQPAATGNRGKWASEKGGEKNEREEGAGKENT